MEYSFENTGLLKLNQLTSGGRVIYYDASCNLCIRTVHFIHRYDSHQSFEFVPLQYLEKDRNDNSVLSPLSSVLLVDNNKIFSKSDAVCGFSGIWECLFRGSTYLN
ncbi:MAG: DUF393 domain-containing protein [Chloroflexia bacterium]|nr:DUF393 domain-containing protein [Chloroflexia bacterium]